MAIYQYYLAFIPQVGLLKKYGVIPTEMNVTTEDGYFNANTEQYWELAGINFDNIKLEIDRLIDKADWGNDEECFNWKTYTNEVDNDASMSVNSLTKKIEHLSFRADLRESKLKFLNGMLDLAKKKEMLLMDRKGKIFSPEYNEIENYIKNSNSFKFIENPEKFLDDLSKGKITIE
ncbi:MAG: hypothetical protein RL699_1247 [Bacteroidota bacterium]|jgi:hypothetical protein